MWPQSQQDWPWPITIYQAINTRETSMLEYCLLFQAFYLESQMFIT